MLWGWSPETTTTTILSEVVWWKPWTWLRVPTGTTSRTEPEFNSEQREMLVALNEYEADLGHHGHSFSRATSPLADPNNRAGTYTYIAGKPGAEGLPVVDYAQAAIDRASKAYYDAYPEADRSGHVWFATEVDRTAS